MDYTQLIEQFPELNMANYSEDEVSDLNAWGVKAANAIEALQARVEKLEGENYEMACAEIQAGPVPAAPTAKTLTDAEIDAIRCSACGTDGNGLPQSTNDEMVAWHKVRHVRGFARAIEAALKGGA